MKTAYFDCFSGVSGDMFAGALIDAGLGIKILKGELSKLGLEGYTVSGRKVLRGGLRGTKFSVRAPAPGPPRRLGDILGVIEKSGLDEDVKKEAEEVFRSLAKAEGKVHGAPPSEVHFHEIGGIDCTVDIVSAFAALKLMGVGKVFASEINVGSGFADASHGRLPVPSPAAAELLKGAPLYSWGAGELATPTGAAILRRAASAFGKMPPMKVERIGYGAGEKDLPFPNLLRVFIGEEETTGGDTVLLVEANIDNTNPEFFGHAAGRLFGAGALDVFMTPVYMKKQRPGTRLSVLCGEDSLERISGVFFRETSSIGLRYSRVFRKTLPREKIKVKTEYGLLGVKLSFLDNEVLNVSPEYDDCSAAALKHGAALSRVYEAAKKISEKWLKK